MRTKEIGEKLKPVFTLKSFARAANISLSFNTLRKPQDTGGKDQGLPGWGMYRRSPHCAQIPKGQNLSARANQQ